MPQATVVLESSSASWLLKLAEGVAAGIMHCMSLTISRSMRMMPSSLMTFTLVTSLRARPTNAVLAWIHEQAVDHTDLEVLQQHRMDENFRLHLL